MEIPGRCVADISPRFCASHAAITDAQQAHSCTFLCAGRQVIQWGSKKHENSVRLAQWKLEAWWRFRSSIYRNIKNTDSPTSTPRSRPLRGPSINISISCPPGC